MSYKYIIGAGHTPSGTIGSGAGGEKGQLNESNCTREIAPLVVEGLKSLGYSAKYSVFERGNTYLYEDCYTRAKNANTDGCELYVEIHLNAGGGVGCEVVTSSNTSKSTTEIAARVSSSIAKEMNFTDRGIKQESLIVLRYTSMPAILIEVCFVDSSDVLKYDPQKYAKAIILGLTGKTISTDNTKLGWNKNDIGWWYCTDIINKYYFKDQWKLIDGEWYSFDSQGYARQSTWIKDQGKWYWLKDSCKMAKLEWLYIDEECYCFSNTGALYINTVTPDGYKVDKSGAWIK